MLNDYGFLRTEWDNAKEEAKTILIDVARRGECIAYSGLAHQIRAIQIEAHDPRMFHLLGEISSEEDQAGRGMLTVIVVHRSGDMRPGPGFFELAELLGKDTSDPEVFWIEEFKRVCDYWRNEPA